ncbi:MAG: hypothetical protein JWR05_1870 [Mucilaginibacter sp.]|nr:hypothetical protein [Mucilaginibacter sp.]
MRFKSQKLFFYFSMLFVLTSVCTYAQDAEFGGKVVSATNKTASPYVNISIVAKGINTVTNEDGLFNFKFQTADPHDSILFSSIGYLPKKISVEEALREKSMVITLTESVEQLKEVVIRALSLKQMLDSIAQHSRVVFISPMKLNGYYREFVFTNNKCNEHSDALFGYYYDSNIKSDPQLSLTASRCEKAVKKNNSQKDFEAYIDSRTNPNKMFSYAMFAGMIEQYFPDKELDNYNYNLEEDPANHNLRVTLYPKMGVDKPYKLEIWLNNDFMMSSYKLTVPAELLKNVKEKNVLGIHGRVTNFIIEVKYNAIDNKIYPEFFSIKKSVSITGKFLGIVINQITEQRSEFIVTQIITNDIKPFQKNEIYKKGNICDNGVAINTAYLKSYNFILPTKKDSLAISGISKDIATN